VSKGHGAGYLPEERSMKNKLLIISSAALLAGTMAAAGQSIQPGGAQEKGQPGASQGAQSKQAPKGGQAQRSEDRQGQTQGQAQRDQDKLKSQGQAQGNQDKAKSQTQGQAERDQDKSKSPTQGQVQRDQDKSKTQTQGQVQRDQDKSKTQTQGQTQGLGPREEDRQGSQPGVREGERRGGNVSITLSTEQRTQIREKVLRERNAPRVGKVNFSIREGTVVPRSVHVVEVPDILVEVHPEWRNYKYFIVNNELVIVDPETLKIVAVVDV
jgi:Protein of unknown function (DUF1236)